MPTCPYCKEDLQYDNMHGTEDNYYTIYHYWYGTCLTCGRHYKWVERYDFINFYDLEEEKELD